VDLGALMIWPHLKEGDNWFIKTVKEIARDAWFAVPIIAVIVTGRIVGWW
jgi:hypothetical protein